jgi:hypothetical protein
MTCWVALEDFLFCLRPPHLESSRAGRNVVFVGLADSYEHGRFPRLPGPVVRQEHSRTYFERYSIWHETPNFIHLGIRHRDATVRPVNHSLHRTHPP